jgi:hypothetical protein
LALPNQSQPLPQPLVIPDVMTMRTLVDLRKLLNHLPPDRKAQSTWRYVVTQLEAAATGSIDPIEASIALRLLLTLEGVRCNAG